jgi:hypothetical protein
MVLATLSETAPVVLATCTAGVALLLIGAWFAKKEIAKARGADKIVALTNLCMAIPLAVVGDLPSQALRESLPVRKLFFC